MDSIAYLNSPQGTIPVDEIPKVALCSDLLQVQQVRTGTRRANGAQAAPRQGILASWGGEPMSLKAMVDRAEIAEVIYRYCRGIDRMDEDLMKSCYHPESMHVKFGNKSHEFCKFAVDGRSKYIITHHQVGNMSIELNGDFAAVETYFTAYHRFKEDDPANIESKVAGLDWFVGGRYRDRFERRDGGWKMIERDTAHEWMRYEAPSDRGFLAEKQGKFEYR